MAPIRKPSTQINTPQRSQSSKGTATNQAPSKSNVKNTAKEQKKSPPVITTKQPTKTIIQASTSTSKQQAKQSAASGNQQKTANKSTKITTGIWRDNPEDFRNLPKGYEDYSIQSPYVSGPSFKSDPDKVTGISKSFFAPFIYNAINGASGEGDGKKYTAIFSNQEMEYYNGKLNLYSDSNGNGKLDPSDKLIGILDPDKAKDFGAEKSLVGKSGTWTLTESNVLTLFYNSHPQFAVPVPSGLLG